MVRGNRNEQTLDGIKCGIPWHKQFGMTVRWTVARSESGIRQLEVLFTMLKSLNLIPLHR